MWKKNILTLMVLLPLAVAGQMERRTSPLSMVTSRYKDTYLKITYSQPQAKERVVFGGLVPYGKVWRTGANEATELTVTHPITVNGTEINAGTYSIFTVPDKNKWTIIFNSDLGQWGSYNYNEKKDVIRFDVPVQKINQPEEAFKIQIDPLNNKAIVSMRWEHTQVSFEILYSEPPAKK
ncbi:MAG: DUF2911 domain-containing protein [Cyclobacteriaceae bacterium]